MGRMNSKSGSEQSSVRRSRRLALGMTQLAVAAAALIPQSKLSPYESGAVDLTAEELARLDAALGIVPLKSMLKAEASEPAQMDPKLRRRFLRKEARLSQYELCRRAKIGRSALSNWELGRSELKVDAYARWAAALQDALKGTLQDDPAFQLEQANKSGQRFWEANGALRKHVARLERRITDLERKLAEVRSLYEAETDAALKHEQARLAEERAAQLRATVSAQDAETKPE